MLLPARGANVPDYVQEPSYVTVHGSEFSALQIPRNTVVAVDFADASDCEASAKSTATSVLYGSFSSEESDPCTVTLHTH